MQLSIRRYTFDTRKRIDRPPISVPNRSWRLSAPEIHADPRESPVSQGTAIPGAVLPAEHLAGLADGRNKPST